MAFGLNPLQTLGGGGGAFAAAGAGSFFGGGGGCNPIQGLLGGLMKMLSGMLGQHHCHHHHHGFPMGQQANFGQGPNAFANGGNAFAQAGPGFAQAGAGGSFAQAGIGPNGPYAFAGAAGGLQNFLA